MAFNSGRTDVDKYWLGHQACPLQRCVAYRYVQLLTLLESSRHSLGSAQNCPVPIGSLRSLCTLGAKESHRWWQSSLYGTVWAFLVSIWHVTLIKESSFGVETWLITQNLKPEKECVIDYHLPPAKKMEALSSVKMTVENWLGTINMCLFWISLIMVTLFARCYCGTLSLWWPFFAKALVTSLWYWPFAWKCQASYTQLDTCLWLYIW